VKFDNKWKDNDMLHLIATILFVLAIFFAAIAAIIYLS